jgi:hypothetical protein
MVTRPIPSVESVDMATDGDVRVIFKISGSDQTRFSASACKGLESNTRRRRKKKKADRKQPTWHFYGAFRSPRVDPKRFILSKPGFELIFRVTVAAIWCSLENELLKSRLVSYPSPLDSFTKLKGVTMEKEQLHKCQREYILGW